MTHPGFGMRHYDLSKPSYAESLRRYDLDSVDIDVSSSGVNQL